MPQLLEQLRERADDLLTTQKRLQGLLRANAAVASDLSLPALLLHVVDAAKDLVQASFAAIVVLGHDEQLESFVHAGMDAELLTRISRLPGGRGILGLLTAVPHPVALSSSRGSRPPEPGPPAGSFLNVAIPVGDGVYGNLYLRADPASAFAPQDRELVAALAGTAGVAIANARLLAESEQRRRWLAASSVLTNQLLSAMTGEHLSWLTDAATTVANADFSMVTVPHGVDEVRVAAATGETARRLIDQVATAVDSPAGRTIRSGTPVLLVGCSGDVGDSDGGPTIIVPLCAGSDTRGALTIGRSPGRARFTRAELDMAATFAVHATVTLALADARDTRINEAQVDDHDRIALEMHDHVMGELFAVGMGLQGLAAASRQPAQAARITTYVDSLDRVITAIRTTIFQLQPRRRDPVGLGDRLQAVAETHTDQLGYRPQLHLDGPVDRDVPAALVADVLAVTREALSNCARHAAASQVTVSLDIHANVLTLRIADDGRGVGTPVRSSGLANMAHRAHHHGGTFEVTVPDNGGTLLTWTAICAVNEVRGCDRGDPRETH